MPHDLGLPWRTDDPFPDVIIDSDDYEVANLSSSADCAFIVTAVNNHDALVKALTELSNMYTHAWDRVDGGLTMFGSSVDRFQKAHRDAHVLLCAIKGEPLHVDVDEDDTVLVSGPGDGE